MQTLKTAAMSLALLWPSLACGQEPDAADRAGKRREEMAARVDALLGASWSQAGIQPGPQAEDAEFFRRAALDLTGVIPRVSEVRAFLADTKPDKRRRAIDRFLVSPRHATHLANTWRNILLPKGVGREQLNSVIGVQSWLRRQFAANMRYDRMVADLLVARGGGQTGPALFYTANDLAPEKLAAATSRIFLGLQIECAQCHKHPFDHWEQSDFWGYAAFFARLRRSTGPRGAVQLQDASSGEVKIPETDTVVPPTYPDGKPADVRAGGSRRVQLAIWMASRDNPYLARATVNRIWSQMFGFGLVEPVDDIGKHNLPSHPQLFDELARYFVRSGFDVREMYRTLANTKAYQRSSRLQKGPPPADTTFARMAIKPLNPEQFYDSLLRVLSAARSTQAQGNFDARRQAFIARLGQSRHITDYQKGVPQALTMMNGVDISEATSQASGGILAAIDAPFLNEDEKLNILFLATLSRPARAKEIEVSRKLLKHAKSKEKGFGDVLWALLNSAEFAMNH